MKRNKTTPLYSYVDERAERIAKEIADLVGEVSLDQGGVVFVYGTRYGGKTLMAIKLSKLFKGKTKLACAVPDVKRSDLKQGYLYSKSGLKIPAQSIGSVGEVEELFDNHEVVIFDSVQFIAYDMQSHFLKEVDEFVERGGWFIGIGLLYTSQRTEFLISALIRHRATREFHVQSTCEKCGRRKADYQQRLVDGKPPSVGDPEILPPSDRVVYEARCEECHVVYN